MVLTTSYNSQGEIQELSLGSNVLETTFDLVNRLVEAGYHLQSVELLDTELGSAPIPFPVEVFDGVPFKAPIEELLSEVGQLLNQE